MHLPLIVVSHPKDLEDYRGPRLTADEYLARDPEVDRVINLCRSSRYLSKGYYVSLLAEARGAQVLPTPSDVLGLQSPRLLTLALRRSGVDALPADTLLARTRRRTRDEHDPDPERPPLTDDLGQPGPDPTEVSLLLGRAQHPSFHRLAAAVFGVYRLPLLRLHMIRGAHTWQVQRVDPLRVHTLEPAERAALLDLLHSKRLPSWAFPPRDPTRASLAVLFDEHDPFPPSTLSTLDRFARIAASMGVYVRRIGLTDLARLGDYDALWIRTITGPDRPAFGFALRAEALGIPAIDDSASILRCSNKVFLHERLTRAGLPTPPTRIVDEDASYDDLAATLGTPFVVKLPDGSFSTGVFKVRSPEDYTARTAPLFARSPLLLAQGFVQTEFDWRIGVLGGRALFACRYHMARGHWQIAAATRRGARFGRVEAVALDATPRDVLDTAVAAANLMGDGLYGVDLKQGPDGPVVIEVNDNPNLEVGEEDAERGDVVYRELIAHFLSRIQRAPLPNPTPTPGPVTLRTPEPPPSPPYEAYAVCGLELEYPIVDADLEPLPLVAPLLRALAGRPTSDASLGAVALSNELPDHLLELKTVEPLADLADCEQVLTDGVRHVSRVLAERFGAQLLPTAMHPWLDPARTSLWSRSGRRIYGTYARIFRTQTHGWRNVQSCHVNLPLGSDAEAVRMIHAAALLIPYLPALAASSPIYDNRLGPSVDNRVELLFTHQAELPETTGNMIPEYLERLADYRTRVLHPMYRALDRFPDTRAIRREYLNARSAVFKFSRASMEVRILDTQECVRLDATLAAFVRAALQALALELADGRALPDHDALAADLRATTAQGSRAQVQAPHLLPTPGPVRDALAALWDKARPLLSERDAHYATHLESLLERGSLSEALARHLRPHADDPARFRAHCKDTYTELARCLVDNTPWDGRLA